jgi:DNA-binding NarL/FixJ family response regulator
MSVSIVIVDDHAVVRVGLTTVLADRPDFQVKAAVGTAEEAVAAVALHRPDVLVLDLRLPDRPGTAIVPDVRRLSPVTRILVLTSYGEDRAVVEAVAAGVDGFLVKSADSARLITAIDDLMAGRPMLGEQVADALVRHLQTPADTNPTVALADRLTKREMEVVMAVSRGLSNREIGDQLGLSEKTVKNHISDILSKLGFARRAQIVVLVHEQTQRYST